MALQRRPHQTRAVADVLSGFRKHDRGQLIMACGTGKTAVVLWVKEDLDAMRTLVLVPSLALVDQFASEWRKHHAPDQEYATLCVCSDSTVGQSAGDDYDAVNFTAGELAQDGFDVTSDPERIAAFLSEGGRRVIFSTYQSSHLLATAQEDESVPAFDLAIADEAHRCTGDGNSVFATILDGDRIRAARRLFATATPRIYRTRKSNEEIAATVVDMSDETKFGSRFHTLTFGEAIRQDLLSDYQVVIMMVDRPEIQSILALGDQSSDKQKIQMAAQVGLLKAIREFNLRRVITFHSRIKDASVFALNLPAVATAMSNGGQDVWLPFSDSVSGEMTAQLRQKKLEAFQSIEEKKKQCRILANARCLAEGVDVPELDGVAFIDPRSSHIDIIQALGRAIRKHHNKTCGTVVLPVFLGEGDSPVKVVENSNFSPVLDVLNALRAHDLDFETALNRWHGDDADDRLQEESAFRKIKFVGTEYAVELARVLRPRLVEGLTDGWDEGFKAASARHAKYGHCNVPDRLSTWPEGDPNGFRLGYWLNTQRTNYKAGMLSRDRIEKLEALKIIWRLNDAKWMDYFQCAKDYAQIFGHCNAKEGTTWPPDDSGGLDLGNWLIRQRQIYKGQVANNSMSPERVSLLESIGIIWEPREFRWETGYQCAREYAVKYGHCNATQRCTWPEDDPNGFRIGVWINSQRRSFRGRKGRRQLTDDQIVKLESIGIVWDALEAKFDDGFKCASAYYAIHGHCNAKEGTTWPEGDPHGFRLGTWITTKRNAYKRGALPERYILKLESIGITWKAKTREVHECLENLVDCLKNEEASDDLPEQMAHFGCNPDQSRALIEAGAYDEALELLEEATGESLRMKLR